MYIEQMYTPCLAEAAYYIESDGEAAIIDPIRETTPYINKSKERNSKIKYIFETHFHADFVSGHIDLAKETGAEIVYGPSANPSYPVTCAKDLQEFKIGKLTLRVLHTPGHTPESSCFLLFDENNKEYAVFTGDTLFVGDVGRPDLAVSAGITPRDLAGQLYDSIQSKLAPLADHILVYPAHGPGSACGKNMAKETWSTMGEQKKSNYAFNVSDKAEFVKEVTHELIPPPKYFSEGARINREGYSPLKEILENNLKPLSTHDVLEEVNQGALILDTRLPDIFATGFIPGSINIGLDGSFAIWVGTIIPVSKKIIIVADDKRVEESVTRLARIGFENVGGYLKGGFDTWKNEGLAVDTIQNLTSVEFKDLYMSSPESYELIDVRKIEEFNEMHLKDGRLFPLNVLESKMNLFKEDGQYLIFCAAGYRSMVAASIFKSYNIKNVSSIRGGLAGIKEVAQELILKI